MIFLKRIKLPKCQKLMQLEPVALYVPMYFLSSHSYILEVRIYGNY